MDSPVNLDYAQYTPLSINAERLSVEDTTYPFQNTDKTGRWLFRLACIGAIISTTVSLTILIFPSNMLSLSSFSKSTRTSTPLPRPNSYVNLDNVLTHSHRNLPPIHNFPEVVLQLDRSNAAHPIQEDSRGMPTHDGYIYLDDRHIVVTPQNTSLLQFRVKDWAMERCVITFILPKRSESFEPFPMLTDPSWVDVWILDKTTEMSRHIPGSMEIVARRKRLLATAQITTQGAHNIAEFPCLSNTFITVELACTPSSAECFVDFWQSPNVRPPHGIYITQYAGRADTT